MTWELLWKVTFIVVAGAFGVLSVLVTILGARDVRRLIRALKDEETTSAAQSEEERKS